MENPTHRINDVEKMGNFRIVIPSYEKIRNFGR
jgi:hypothetical protein